MEFSFDKSKSSQMNKTSANGAAQDPFAEARSQHQKSSPSASNFSSESKEAPEKSAEERLRKAIERNRLKQQIKDRADLSSARTATPEANPTREVPRQAHVERVQAEEIKNTKNDNAEQASFLGQEERVQRSERPTVGLGSRARVVGGRDTAPIAQAEQATREESNQTEKTSDLFEKKMRASTAVVTRQRVARVDETEFATPVKKIPKKMATPAYVTKKKQSVDPKWLTYLVRGSWVFCALMLVRLFFSQGGVVDFYGQTTILKSKKLEFDQIKSENFALAKEIEKMQSDAGYQKKIVRDNLGFIAADEFLVLFPKEI